MRNQLHRQLLNLDYHTRRLYGRIEVFDNSSSTCQIRFIATRPIPRSLSLLWQLLDCLESRLGGNLFELAEEYYDLAFDVQSHEEDITFPRNYVVECLPSELARTLEIAAECQIKASNPQMRERVFQLVQTLENSTSLDADSLAEIAFPLVRAITLQTQKGLQTAAEVIHSYLAEETDPLRCNILNCLFEDAVAHLPKDIRLARIIGNPSVSFLAKSQSQLPLDLVKISSLSLSEGAIVRVIQCLWEQQLDFDIEKSKELSLPQFAICRTEVGQMCLVPREALQFIGRGQEGDR